MQILLQRYNSSHERVNQNQERVTSNEPRSISNRERSNVNNDSTSEIDDFLQDSSIRDRLRRLPSVQETVNNIDIHRLTNLFSDADNANNTGFKQTLKEIIMVPYIENNKTVSRGSKM